MGFAFDGNTKRITLTPGTVTLNLPELYSRWKDWARTNGGFLIAFSTVGGEIPRIPLYLFLENGWRIVPQQADHALVVTGGTLEVQGGGDPFLDPVGSYKIRIKTQEAGIAIGYSTNGVSGPSAAEVAQAVRSELAPELTKINQGQLQGAGPIQGLSPVPKVVLPSSEPAPIVRQLNSAPGDSRSVVNGASDPPPVGVVPGSYTPDGRKVVVVSQ